MAGGMSSVSTHGNKESGLTPLQERFITEYFIDLNATQAAIRAGYSPKTAYRQGADLLQKTSLRARIEVALAERSKRTAANADRLLLELARIAFVDVTDLISPKDGTLRSDVSLDDASAIISVKVQSAPIGGGREVIKREVKLVNKVRALELLGRHLGMLA